jgi:hypothetical protein
MHTLSPVERACNAPANLRACELSAYLDTVEIWLPFLRIEAYREIARLGRVEECRNRHGQLVGCRVIRNQPSKAVLQQLDQLARKHRGVLHRVDVALDIEPRPELRDRIVSTARLKWSRKGQMHEIGRTVYWSNRKRSRRNLVLYDDKHNRLSGETECIHFELRLMGADSIRRQGIHRARDLLMLNPKTLFEKHIKWSDAGDGYVKKIMRRENNRYRQKYKGKQVSKVMDGFLAYVPRHVKHVLNRLGLDRSQNVRSEQKDEVDALLAVACELEWVERSVKMSALKSLSNSKKHPQGGCLITTNRERMRRSDARAVRKMGQSWCLLEKSFEHYARTFRACGKEVAASIADQLAKTADGVPAQLVQEFQDPWNGLEDYPDGQSPADLTMDVMMESLTSGYSPDDATAFVLEFIRRLTGARPS